MSTEPCAKYCMIITGILLMETFHRVIVLPVFIFWGRISSCQAIIDVEMVSHVRFGRLRARSSTLNYGRESAGIFPLHLIFIVHRSTSGALVAQGTGKTRSCSLDCLLVSFEAQCALGEVRPVRFEIKLLELKVQMFIRLGQFWVNVTLGARTLVIFLMNSGRARPQRRCAGAGI